MPNVRSEEIAELKDIAEAESCLQDILTGQHSTGFLGIGGNNLFKKYQEAATYIGMAKKYAQMLESQFRRKIRDIQRIPQGLPAAHMRLQQAALQSVKNVDVNAEHKLDEAVRLVKEAFSLAEQAKNPKNPPSLSLISQALPLLAQAKAIMTRLARSK